MNHERAIRLYIIAMIVLVVVSGLVIWWAIGVN